MAADRPLVLIYRALSRERRRQLFVTLAAMLAGAAAEMLTIGAALAFLALIADPAGTMVPPGIARALDFGFGAMAGASLLLIVTALTMMAVRLALLWLSHGFVAALGRDLSTAIFGRMLRQPYSAYLGRNSSELLAAIEKTQRVAGTVLPPAMQGLIGAVLAFFIALLLFAIDPFAATLTAVAVAAAYAAVNLIVRRRLHANSAVIALGVTARTQTAREALGAIRDVLLDRSQPAFEARFSAVELAHRRAIAQSSFIAAAPRFVIEAAGIAALALVALAMSLRPGGIVAAIPVLGTLALGAQRLLPLVQQAWFGWSALAASRRLLADVAALLTLPVNEEAEPAAPLPFGREIAFERVSFAYPERGPSLHGVSFSIRRGERVGVTGPTGSGKSTLVDLLVGLLEPREGVIRIDGAPLDAARRGAWQANIAHVPQSIYLVDDSIAANIALGEPAERIDVARVREAARAAQLEPFLAGLADGLETTVGERGVRLSGGQRQRIGLARALYRRPALLVLDEATSALDDDTEAAVLQALAALGRAMTVVIVAHRASTLALCDRVIRLGAGRLQG